MKSVSKSIIEWLEQFQGRGDGENHGMKNISTDILPARTVSYSLAKEPVINKKTYISGKKVFKEHYCLMARLDSQETAAREINAEWGECLERWVRKQNKSGNYPRIEGAKVRELDITTPFYMGRTDTNNSVYQMTLMIKYETEV